MGNNVFRIEVAGSGKTYGICKDVILKGRPENGKRVLIVTYTNNGKAALEREYKKQNDGLIDDYVDVFTWYHFLLADMIKPYQVHFPGVDINEIHSIDFSERKDNQYGDRTRKGKHDTDKRVYINPDSTLAKDFASEFAFKSNNNSKGLSIRRLESIYQDIYFDEVQDLAGWDIDILKELVNSSVNITAVGDPYQTTYSTNYNPKNKKLSGENIANLASSNGFLVEHRTKSRRCNEPICSFAMRIGNTPYQISSGNFEKTGHDGVFLVCENDSLSYYSYFKPQVLIYSKRDLKHRDWNAITYGASKGLTFDRTLISSTKPLKSFILNNCKTIESPNKYYVAVTRARFSVCIIVDTFPPDYGSRMEMIEVEGGKLIHLYRLF